MVRIESDFIFDPHCFYLLLNRFPGGGLGHEPDSSSSLPEFGGVPQQSPLVVQTHAQPPAPQSPPAMLHDLQQPDSTSYVLLNLAKGRNAQSIADCTDRLISYLLATFPGQLPAASLDFREEKKKREFNSDTVCEFIIGGSNR